MNNKFKIASDWNIHIGIVQEEFLGFKKDQKYNDELSNIEKIKNGVIPTDLW